MPRKKWVSQKEITPALIKVREKRKWQIALRRYVLDKNRCLHYAPYFGLDIEHLRKWFELQFSEGAGWADFAEKWQFGHIIPVTYFNFADDNELKLCWNFVNLRVELVQNNKETGFLAILAAKKYFTALYNKTHYSICLKLITKLEKLDMGENRVWDKQQAFIIQNKPYLDQLQNYSAFEFELLNSGRTLEQVAKEINFLKRF